MTPPSIIRFPTEPTATLTQADSCGQPMSNLCCRTATSRQDLTRAFELLQQRYAETGLASLGERTTRIMPYQLSVRSQIFVAESRGEIVGTVTLVGDSTAGLPIETSYRKPIPGLRHPSRRIGEITSLAIESTNVSHTRLLLPLTRLLTSFAHAQQIDDLVAVVHPRHAKFYMRALGVQVIGPEMPYQPVGGSPGVAVGGSVNDAQQHLRRWEKAGDQERHTNEQLTWQSIGASDLEHFQKRTNPNQSRAA